MPTHKRLLAQLIRDNVLMARIEIGLNDAALNLRFPQVTNTSL